MEIDYFELAKEAFGSKKVSFVFDRINKEYHLQTDKTDIPMRESDFFELFFRLLRYANEQQDTIDDAIDEAQVIDAFDNRITKIAEDIETIGNINDFFCAYVEKITDEEPNVKYRIDYNDAQKNLSYEEAIELLRKLEQIAGFHKQSGENYTKYPAVAFFIVMLKVVVKEENLNVEEYLNTKV